MDYLTTIVRQPIYYTIIDKTANVFDDDTSVH